MTTKTKAQPKPQKRKNEKYRVIPNLSYRGKDIMSRLKNGSLKPQSSGEYSLLPEIDETRRMSQLDIKRKAQENAHKIKGYQDDLGKQPQPQTVSQTKKDE